MPKSVSVATPLVAAGRDWRVTNQRLAILNTLRADSTHPTAEEVFRKVRRLLPHVSFGTVYRNLNFLRSHGYIKEFVIDRVSRYEGRVDTHVHLVCEHCRTIEDLTDETLAKEAKRLSYRSNFFARTDNLEIRGLCSRCQKKMSIKKQTPELFCLACGELLDELETAAPVCRSCCFKTNCQYYGHTKK
jgi:Fur family peroxide stress response transcriptional regulator